MNILLDIIYLIFCFKCFLHDFHDFHNFRILPCGYQNFGTITLLGWVTMVIINCSVIDFSTWLNFFRSETVKNSIDIKVRTLIEIFYLNRNPYAIAKKANLNSGGALLYYLPDHLLHENPRKSLQASKSSPINWLILTVD